MKQRNAWFFLLIGTVSCANAMVACSGNGNNSSGDSSSGEEIPDGGSSSSNGNVSSSSSGNGGNGGGGGGSGGGTTVPVNDFLIESPDGTGPVVVAAVSEAAADNSGALEQAFAAANNGGTVSIPPGRYAFTNNIDLSNGQNVIVEGNGARLVLTKGASLFIQNSSQLRLQNLIIDWDWDKNPLAYFAVVKSNTGGEIQLEFPLDVNIPDSIDWSNVEMIDPVTFAPAKGGSEWWYVNPAGQQKLDAKTIRIWGFNGNLSAAVPGTALRIRQYNNANLGQHVWYLDNASHTVFNQVQIYSGSYMGYVLTNNTHHILLDSCRIVPDPEATGSKKILSTFADGLHIGHFTGYLGVINSEFSHQGDDALNIKQNVASKVTRTSNTTLFIETEQWFAPFSVGDVLELRRYADHTIIGSSPPVTNVQWGGNTVTLTFGSDLPMFTGSDNLAINKRFNTGQYFVRNNHFHHNRARGILPKLPNGIIDGNLIEGNSMPGILFEFGRWDNIHAEGSFIDNVKITNNKIVNTNQYGWYPAPITYRINGMNYVDTTAFPQLFSNLTIQDNIF